MKEKLTIIKVGGKIVEEESTLNQLLADFSAIEGYKLLVHGGGRSATRLAAQLGIESKMVNGRRITDADTIAGETAKALASLFDVTLVYCFEKKGVLRDENDDDSVIPVITPEEFKEFVAQGIIQGGMIPKLENSFSAIDAGVSQVVITLASAINEGSGTVIKK